MFVVSVKCTSWFRSNLFKKLNGSWDLKDAIASNRYTSVIFWTVFQFSDSIFEHSSWPITLSLAKPRRNPSGSSDYCLSTFSRVVSCFFYRYSIIFGAMGKPFSSDFIWALAWAIFCLKRDIFFCYALIYKLRFNTKWSKKLDNHFILYWSVI